MCHEWRSNLWMIIELAIVGIILWGVFSIFATIIYCYRPPKGVDFNNVCIGRIGYIPESATSYKQYPDTMYTKVTDLDKICSNLRSNPYVESVGLGENALPYSFSYYGSSYQTNIADSVQIYYCNERYMNPDMVRTLRFTGVNGESSEALAAVIERGEWLISKYINAPTVSTPELWVGKEIQSTYDSTKVYRVGALIEGFSRADFEPMHGGVMIQPLKEDCPSQIAVRVQPGTQQKFLSSLKKEDLKFGNVYVTNMMTIEDCRESANHDIDVVIRNTTACALFVMIAVFLGFLGSFWYRTQQRVPEIALREVNGATKAQIFRRFLGEGMILLLVAALPITAFVAWALLYGSPDMFEIRYWLPELWWWMLPVTLAVLALMIVAGIWFPARKAMKINPAEAIKDQ